MAPAIRLAVLGVAFALATIALGWWALVPVGILWGLVAASHVRRASLVAGLAAGAGWLGLLAVAAPVEETATLLTTASRLLSLPAPLIVTVTVGLGALLAFLGSWLGLRLRFSSHRP